MGQFKKKPIVIEAFQITEETRQNNVDWPNWLHEAWNKATGETGGFWCITLNEEEYLFVGTEEGPLKVSLGDWIIRGIQGEIYPCKPDIFEETYDAVGTITPIKTLKL